MSKYAMDQLKEKLCRELDFMAEKSDLSSTDLDRSYKIMDVLKNIYKIDMYESGGYSGDGDMYPRDYERGSSYRNRESRGRYSGRGYSRDGGYSRSGYSRDGEYSGSTIEEHLEAMMRDARNDEERRMIEEMRRKLM